MTYLIITIVAGCLLWLYLRYVSQRGIPVLMYHKVLPDQADDLTVSVSQLEEHIQYLQLNGYQILHLERLKTSVLEKVKLPLKPAFLTFDDGYLNNLEYAYPLLVKYNVPATIFLPTNFIGKKSAWDKQADDLMNIEQLKSLNPSLITFGLHSHTHRNYKTLGIEQIKDDLQKNIRYFKDNGLSYVPAFAYPYGGRPKNRTTLRQMKQIMQSLGVVMAFRIGNRLNKSYSNNVYELQRIDIKGTDSLAIFRKKVMGKMKILF